MPLLECRQVLLRNMDSGFGRQISTYQRHLLFGGRSRGVMRVVQNALLTLREDVHCPQDHTASS